MEPLTAATSFATIIGLISNFIAERRNSENVDINDFLAWVSDHGFDDLRGQIEANQKTTVSIKALLTENSEVVLERLNTLDNVLASVASEVQGVKELAIATVPNISISEQSVSLLRQLEEKEASGFFELKVYGGSVFEAFEGGQLEYSEPRFVEDDLNTLVKLGFLRHEVSAKGTSRYGFTRAASTYVKLLGEKL